MASEPDNGRIRPLQLFRKVFHTSAISSLVQPGSAAQVTGTNLPAKARGGVSRMADNSGTTKGWSAMSGTAAAGAPASSCSRGTVLQAATKTSRPQESRILFIRKLTGVVLNQCNVRGMARTNSPMGTSKGMPLSPTQW